MKKIVDSSTSSILRVVVVWQVVVAVVLLVCGINDVHATTWIRGLDNNNNNNNNIDHNKGRDLTLSSLNVADENDNSDGMVSWGEYNEKKKKKKNDVVVFSKESCASKMDCWNCTSLSNWCHWCSNDQACHAKGSPYGCVWGETCSNDDNDDDENNNNDDNNNNNNDDDDGKSTTGCSSHSSCVECTKSSRFCHWCAKDNACHAIGFGCTTGVDCFSNDRCKRKQPEHLNSTTTTTSTIVNNIVTRSRQEWEQEKIPFMIVLFIYFILFIGCTLCYCCCCCFCNMKKNVDSLELLEQEEEEQEEQDNNNRNDDDNDDAAMASTPLLSSTGFGGRGGDNNNDDNGEAQATANNSDPHGMYHDDHKGETDRETNDLAQSETVGEEPPPPQGNEAARTLSASSSRFRSGPRHRHRRCLLQPCLYWTCSTCYCFTLIVIVILIYGSIRFFPKVPQYNVCNDNIAWKSLVDSMATMKAEAEFEILISIVNDNPITIALDQGGGYFYHDNNTVGTYSIPPVTALSYSITDILIVAHFETKTWQAFNIGEEYYKGNLILHVDAVGTIRIPTLWNYTFIGQFNDIVVHVNQLSDRQYCHCSSWNDEKKHKNNNNNPPSP